MTITFKPDSNLVPLESVREYEEIWNSEGMLIVDTISRISRLTFDERYINAVVYEGRSMSVPLQLRASLTRTKKRATIVHELCHRLPHSRRRPEQEHYLIYLILYDIWVSLWGEQFANESVQEETGLGPLYRDAWRRALNVPSDQRVATFCRLVNDN